MIIMIMNKNFVIFCVLNVNKKDMLNIIQNGLMILLFDLHLSVIVNEMMKLKIKKKPFFYINKI